MACHPGEKNENHTPSTVATTPAAPSDSAVKGTFGYDAAFLKKHGSVVELTDASGQQKVLVSPALQGRVMTSTLAGNGGQSFGWVNYDFIAAGKSQAHINPYGGEDRFWLGPQGSQFSVYHKKGQPLTLDYWQTPAPLDSELFAVKTQADSQSVAMEKSFSVENYAGTRFDLKVTREIRLLSPAEMQPLFAINPADSVTYVAFQSRNVLTNTGKEAWSKDKGLLSIWILSMLTATPQTTVVVPLKAGAGKAVNAGYFQAMNADRFVEKPAAAFYKADANYFSKIGVAPARAKDVFGSYDAQHQVLTLVKFSFNARDKDYVKSLFEVLKDPYAGDVINAYNDGEPQPGAGKLGNFYELESSSPAKALRPGEQLSHTHTIVHLQGKEEVLNAIAQKQLGVTLADIRTAFSSK